MAGERRTEVAGLTSGVCLATDSAILAVPGLRLHLSWQGAGPTPGLQLLPWAGGATSLCRLPKRSPASTCSWG